MLELIYGHTNTWVPPEIDEEEIVKRVSRVRPVDSRDSYLHIFLMEPYIDALYIQYIPKESASQAAKGAKTKRFTFREGYVWSYEDEEFFEKHIIGQSCCMYNTEELNQIFCLYRDRYPTWHLQRYYGKHLRMLDHIYHCCRRDSAKEILYKAGLDALAVQLKEIDEINLFATKPSQLYGGLPNRVLKSLNCEEGGRLLASARYRDFLMELSKVFPSIFQCKLTDAQCKYLALLVDGKLTVTEVGSLMESRRCDLLQVWNQTQLALIARKDSKLFATKKIVERISKIDPIYKSFFDKVKYYSDEEVRIHVLEEYLLKERTEYDKRIQCANRKREGSWEECGREYLVRFPHSANDFCREAIYMQNCLYSYMEAITKNDTTILFVRKTAYPDQPFITMEICEGKFIQAYHRFNMDCTRAEEAWIHDFCNRHEIETMGIVFNVDNEEV